MIKNLLIICCVACFISSCDVVKHIPVESTRTEKEYIDRWNRDSVFVKDSVFIFVKGDTVFRDRYKMIYKDRFVKDTVLISKTDSIQVPYPVEIPVKHVPKAMWWLVILLSALGLPSIFKIITKLKGLKI
jgi:hypothetical protein